MPDIFKKRVNFKPFEYPQLIDFADSINKSYWLVSEFNFTQDVQDFRTKLNPIEKSAIKRAMLAISQIETQVKTYWADLYKRLPKPEVAVVGMSFAECHIEGTEVLTTKGWVDFRDITKDSKIIQYNTRTNNMSVVNPTSIYSSSYSGNLHCLDNGTYSAKLSPDHRILYYNKNNNLIVKRIGEISGFNSNMLLPFTGKLIGIERSISYFDRLKIAIQADGSKRFWKNSDGKRIERGIANGVVTYEISLKKDRKKERLIEILKNNTFNYRQFNTNRGGYLKIEIDIPVDLDKDFKTFDWVDLSNKGSEWCEEFIQELAEWDGYKLNNKGNSKNCLIKYSTTVKSCADIVQSIGFCAGYRANISTSVDNRKESFSDIYTVSFVKAPLKSSTTTKVKLENYNGNIYCISVTSGCIITRLNNKVLISGNSEVRHERAYAHLLEILGLNEEFEQIIEVPAIKGRINYLEKYLDGSRSKDDRVYTKTILLFSMFIEHVSLFSQFLIIMAFNKEKNLLSGISNVVEATSLEEQVHGLFGAEVINIIRKEHPEWFDDNMNDMIKSACMKAFKAECEIVDWMYEEGDLDFLPKDVVKEFIKNRFNTVLKNGGFDKVFEIDTNLTEKTDWFEVQLTTPKEDDFFYKTSNAYNKKSKPITAEDLF